MVLEKKDSFLESKIQTPTASRNFLVREQLIQRLNDAEERLIIVSAGMGYGKTVLLTHYAKRYPEKCAWYHLSGTDNDIMVFARYLSKSVAKVLPAFQPDFSPYLTLDQDETLVQELALEFAAMFRELGEQEFCVVLDDFQVIENEWIFRFLNIILDHQPGGLRLFLCTKSASPAFCARYLLERSAMVLGADSLAFHPEEVKLLIREYTAPEDLDRVAQAMQTYMEGWPAGVSFAILYFRQRQSRMTERELAQACQQSYLQDYFMHELFRKLPFELQHFLTSTSVLDDLRPDVCNALAGIDNAAGQLSYLERENLFILRISDQLYRCHSLFRSFLQAQLQPRQRRLQLEKASDFYLRTPNKALAAEYALACGDGQRLQNAVETAGREALAQGRLNTLRRWLEGLTALETPPTPEILLLRGQFLQRTGAWREALALAEEVVQRLSGQTGERCLLEAKLLQAQIARERLSIDESLALLQELFPQLRPERSSLAPLRRQAGELCFQNLMDLRQFDRAMALVLAGIEDSARRADQEGLLRGREMAAISFFVMGEYRKSLRMYMVLRGSGGGAPAAPYHALYLAVSGRTEQALAQFDQLMETPPAGLSRRELEHLSLLHAMVGVLHGLAGGAAPAQEPGRGLWESAAARGSLECREFGDLVYLLQRTLRAEPLSRREEDALFGLTTGVFLLVQDGARWLTVRRLAREGETARALELCRAARSDRRLWQEGEGGRSNAFLAFLTLEESLLLRESAPEEAAALAERCARYLTENRLLCPGLTPQEQAALEALLSRRGSGLSLCAAPEEEPDPQEDGAPAKVAVRAFGRLRVLLPDGQELRWRTRKAQELFAYLFHHSGALVDRERLIDVLWPQSAPANATSLLHTSLYNIRKSLAPYGLDQLVQREKKGYRMDMALVESDRNALEEAVRSGDPPDGDLSALYAGPYLEDIEAPWAEDSRAWYAGAFLRLCRSAAEACMERGDFSRAADCLRAAARQEPYDEDLAALLIRCYSAMGEMKNAMAVYNRLKDTLAEDLDAEPGEEVTRIYKECLLRRLGNGRSLK